MLQTNVFGSDDVLDVEYEISRRDVIIAEQAVRIEAKDREIEQLQNHLAKLMQKQTRSKREIQILQTELDDLDY